MLVSVHFNVNALTNTLILLRAGTRSAPWWRASMILDALGYYLFIIPLFIYLRSQLRPAAPNWIDLSTLGLLASCVMGAVGATILATVVPTLMRAFAHASTPAQLTSLRVTFTSYSDAIYRGIWDLFDVMVAAVGWLGFATVLRAPQPKFARGAFVIGAACVLTALGTVLNVEAIAQVGLGVYLLVSPVWVAWIGGALLRTSSALFLSSGATA